MSRCWHTRRSGRSTSGLLSFSHFNLKVCVDFMEEEQFFTHWSEARGDVRFCTRPVTEEDNGFACENQSHLSRELEHL